MNEIVFPLNRSSQGAAVGDLHEALLLMVERRVLEIDSRILEALDAERREQTYGAMTRRLVTAYQQQTRGLETSGNVDRATAAAVNARLEEWGVLDSPDDRPDPSDETPEPDEPTVSGRIAEADGRGVPRLTVRAFDKRLGREQELGRALTDADGHYTVTYRVESLIDPRRGQADLVVRAFDPAGTLRAASPLIVNALDHETVHLLAGDGEYRGPSLYRRIDESLADELAQVDPDAVEPRDLYSLANTTGLSPAAIHHYVRARSWRREWDALPAEVYFAWFQGGLEPRWGALLEAEAPALAHRVEAAVDENLVPADALDSIERIGAALVERRSDFVLDAADRPISRASVGRLLDAAALDRSQRRALLREWQTFEGDASELWARRREQLGDAAARDLELTLELGFVTRNHVPLVKALKERRGVRSLDDVAHWRDDDWLALFDDAEIEPPDDLRGENDRARRRAFAEALTRATESTVPTRVLARAFERDAEIDSERLDRFFERHTDFEFREQTLQSYLEEHPDAFDDFEDPEAARREVEALQRVFHLSPQENRPAVAKTLWQNRIHSAWAVVLRGEEGVIRLLGAEEGARVHGQALAVQQSAQSVALHQADLQSHFGHALPRRPRRVQGIPDLDTLFGEQGYCECRHCTSFFSPSAYLVDLLLFLQRAPSGSPAAETALELLLLRRADLANLELDCANAETPLPHIDLVVEILENAVAPRSYENRDVVVAGRSLTLPLAPADDPVPQTETDPEILEALPQHLDPAVYDVLRGVGGEVPVFPWELPFDLWTAETRAFLEHLGAPRSRLMESVLGDGPGVASAAEFLGLDPAEIDLLIEPAASTAALARIWGLAGSLQTLASVEEVLARSGLSYGELRRILRLRFVRGSGPEPALHVVFDPPSSCRVADARLASVDRPGLDRLHRFTRLLHRAGETPEGLDRALAARGGRLDGAFLEDLAHLARLESALPRRAERAEILLWLGPIDTHGYDRAPSPYAALFTHRALDRRTASELRLTDDGRELENAADGTPTRMDLDAPELQDLQAHLLSALRWDGDELRAAVIDLWGEPSFELTLENLSHLARIASFCRALRLDLDEYHAAKALYGRAPLAEPGRADVRPGEILRFVEWTRRLRDAGLDVPTLDALLRRPRAGRAAEELEQTLLELRLQADLPQAAGDDTSPRDLLRPHLARVIEPSKVETAVEIVEGASLLAPAEQSDFLTAELTFFPDPAAAAAHLSGPDAGGPGERAAFVLEALRLFLAEGTVVRRLAEATGTPVELTEWLLREHLRHPSDPALPAVRVFLDPAFLAAGADPRSIDDVPDQAAVLIRLHAVGLAASRLDLDDRALAFLRDHGAAAGLPGLTDLPAGAPDEALDPATADAWDALVRLVLLEREGIAEPGSVFDLLRPAFEPEIPEADLLERVAATAGWSVEDLRRVTGAEGAALSHPEGYRSARRLLDTVDAMALVKRVGLPARSVARWTESRLDESHARSVRHAAKAKYGTERWLEVSTKLRSGLRERQRDALVAFVRRHRRKHDGRPFTDDADLYGYFLVDTQVSACARTSRTVLATAAAQLFVQRILLGLEPGVELSRRAVEEWKWRKRYRVWEANRKVLLWPENWIEPELRDDKSPFFQELENELLQDELTEETAERAVSSYLHKLHDVARLELAGIHFDGTDLHVFARSSGTPSTTYYRRWEQRRHWTAWERVELDIGNSEGSDVPPDGVLLLPLVHNRRLFLFWPIFTARHDEPDDDTREAIRFHEVVLDLVEEEIRNLQNLPDVASGLISQKKQAAREIRQEIARLEAGHDSYEIRLAHSEYRQGHWTAERLSRRSVRTPYFEGKFADGKNLRHYFLLPEKTPQGRLEVRCHYARDTHDYRLRSYFEYDPCKGETVAVRHSGYETMDASLPDHMRFMKAEDDAGGSRVPLRVKRTEDHVDLLLEEAANGHLLTTSLDRGVHLHTTPFFYEDDRRAFFVVPPRPRRVSISRAAVASGVLAGQAAPVHEAAAEPPKPLKSLGGRVTVAREAASTETTYHALSSAGGVVVRPTTAAASRVGPRRAGRIAAPRVDLELQPVDATSKKVSAHLASSSRLRWRTRGEYVFRTFYHPYACLFLEQLERRGIDGLLDPDPSTAEGAILAHQAGGLPGALDFRREYAPNWNEVDRLAVPREEITFDHRDPYAAYNWEVFFHVPLLIADRLHQQQRFEAAQRWLHYIFDPTVASGPVPTRYWKIQPFHTYTAEQMERDLEELLAGGFEDELDAWQEDPFNPHLLARFRRVAYMKTTVMKYLDNLIAWGDHLFRQDSRESIAEAAQLYVLAGQILGELPVATEAKGETVSSFGDLAARLDGLGNAWVAIESRRRPGPRRPAGRRHPGLPTLVPYFCFPPNEKLLGYWDVVADRLFKIRHCMSLEGVVRSLPLFQPPIDPALLVRAAASGVDLSSALSDLYAPLPNYRFAVMIRHAKQLCQDVKSLGGALLTALEKRDAEALTRLRSGHETAALEAQREVRARRIEELERSRDSLVEQRKSAQIRFDDYDDRDFMNPAEVLAFGLSRAAGITQGVSAGVLAAGSSAYPVPDVLVGALAGALGGAFNLNHISGGEKTGKGISSAGHWLEMAAMITRDLADMNSTIGSFMRRQEDWDLQCDLAAQEMVQLDQAIAAAEIRIAVAEREKQNLELQITQSRAVEDHHRRKFTGEQLYGWMIGRLSAAYFQTYQLAHDVAKQAERAFGFELGSEPGLVRFGHWDHLRKGLLAGDQLGLDLQRLEMAYVDAHRRDLELTAHVSLRRLDPVALLRLKHLGSCVVHIPEHFYDLSSPGQYHRRIRSVSLTLPAVTGPYVGVHCTLTLLSSSVRRSPEASDGAYGRTPEPDDRFVDFPGAGQSIVTSHAQSDSGLFETSLRDERYLPFEGHGAISTWRLDLPADLRAFDYDTLSDVVLHVRYTARPGGNTLADRASEHTRQLIRNVADGEGGAGNAGLVSMLDLRHDFPTEWHRFVTGDGDFTADLERAHFPYFVHGETLELGRIRLYAFGDDELTHETLELDLDDANDALDADGALPLSLAESEALPRDPEARVFLVVFYGIV